MSYYPGKSLADRMSLADHKILFTDLFCFNVSSSFLIVNFEDFFKFLTSDSLVHFKSLNNKL